MATAKIERHTEKITEEEMKIAQYGENEFGFVYVQGEHTPNSNINKALQKAGGKPDECELTDYSLGGTGHAKFIGRH